MRGRWQIILEGLQPQYLTSKPLNKHICDTEESPAVMATFECSLVTLRMFPRIVGEMIRASWLGGCLIQYDAIS